MRPVVLIYVDTVPPPRMPFVLSQTEALTRVDPYLVGIRRISGDSRRIPTANVFAINNMSGMAGKIREAPFRRFGIAPFFRRRIRRLHPVLLHAHSGFAGVTALGLAEWLGIPLLTTFHGRDATITTCVEREPDYDFCKYTCRRSILARRGDLFIAVSRFMKDKMLELGFPEEKIVVHYTGVDVDYFSPNPEVRREQIALFVGRLDEMKGCEDAILAMSKVQSALPEVEFVVIGDGVLRPGLERTAAEKLRRYRFLGTQPSDVVRHWMNRARIFVVPSVTASNGETETFGMVFAEAQAMKLPVASFASGGIPEAVEDGETGLLAKERDWQALAHNMEVLFRNETMRLRMAEAGRLRVCSHFNLETQTIILEQIYFQMVSLGRQTASLEPENIEHLARSN